MLLEIRDLTRRYGDILALDQVDLEIEEGSVLGLIGRNGAGKTTLIRHVLGLLRAQSGSVRVLGHDPVRNPETVLAGIGYVSEERDLPGWMRIDELLRYMRAFYPDWDDSLARDLCKAFDLDLGQRVRTLSRGQHVRTSLVLALAPRPPLLVLDEPSSGLDPVVRRDVLEAVIANVARDGRTVLFSSHLLDEVERISDHLAMIDRGQILFSEPTETVLSTFHHVLARAPDPAETSDRALATMAARLDQLPGLTTKVVALPEDTGSNLHLLCRLDDEDGQAGLAARLAPAGIETLEVSPATLDEIFLHLSADR